MNHEQRALVIRLTVLAFAIWNQILVAKGYNVLPIEEAELEQAVSTVLTLLAALWNIHGNSRAQ